MYLAFHSVFLAEEQRFEGKGRAVERAGAYKGRAIDWARPAIEDSLLPRWRALLPERIPWSHDIVSRRALLADYAAALPAGLVTVRASELNAEHSPGGTKRVM